MGDRPRLCVHCGKLIGLDDECPYCGTDNSAVSSLVRRAMQPAGASGLTVTQAIVTVNVFLYVTALFIGGVGGGAAFDFLSPDIEILFRIGLQDNAAIRHGQWWRLVMMVFLHLGLLHVAFNCYILHFAGQVLEAEYGGRFTFLIYMVSGLTGSAASYVAGIGGAGASGAVFGVLGAIVVRRRMVDGHFDHPITRQLLSLLAINVVFGLVMSAHINHVAHLGGFVAGAGTSAVLTRVSLGKVAAVALAACTWGCVIITGLAFVSMTVNLFNGSREDFMNARACWVDLYEASSAGFEPERTSSIIRCLKDAHPLETPADVARQEALAGLQQALGAYQGGDGAAHSQGLVRTGNALEAYTRWFADALPRYGLHQVKRSPGHP